MITGAEFKQWLREVGIEDTDTIDVFCGNSIVLYRGAGLPYSCLRVSDFCLGEYRKRIESGEADISDEYDQNVMRVSMKKV